MDKQKYLFTLKESTSPLTYSNDGNPSSGYLINNLINGIYNITVEDNNGCIIDSIVNVTNPTLFNDTTICSTEDLILNAGINWSNLNSFSWHENGELFYNDQTLNISLNNNTAYVVEANDNGCYNVTPLIDTISISVLYPNVDITGGWSEGILLGESIDLYVTGNQVICGVQEKQHPQLLYHQQQQPITMLMLMILKMDVLEVIL